MSITVQLQKFEGPLPLLLYLIRKDEMDIMDIKINEITKQYLDFIKMMKELDLEVAGEFIAMAATLIHIKSRMLLPTYDENGEVVENEDPRKELVQRLLEYQKYQEAGKSLYERPLLGRDVFVRGVREKLEVKDDEILLEDNALFALISAYRSAIRTIKNKAHHVATKTQSIASRILQIKDRLLVGQKIAMSSLITSIDEKRKEVLITFLSTLELAKAGFVSLFQTETYAEIYIEAKMPIENNMIEKVEEYETLNAEDIAQAMMIKAQKIDEQFLEEEYIEEIIHEEKMEAEESESEVPREMADEMATDDEILNAEKELGV